MLPSTKHVFSFSPDFLILKCRKTNCIPLSKIFQTHGCSQTARKEPARETRGPGKASQLEIPLWASVAHLEYDMFQQESCPIPTPTEPMNNAGPSEPTTQRLSDRREDTVREPIGLTSAWVGTRRRRGSRPLTESENVYVPSKQFGVK